MTTPETTTPETAAPTLDDERADLLAELAAARNFLLHTTQGLTDEQAGATPTVSSLSLGALIKHVASTEEAWARFVAGDRSAMSFDLPDGVTWQDLMTGTARTYPQWAIDRENDFRWLPGDTLAGVVARYHEVAARTDALVASVPSLSETHVLPEAPWNEPGAVRSVRRVLIHLVAETTQHAGHADIIRESIDGQKTMG